MNERCVLCGEQAAVRVRGTSFCASCGLSHYSVGPTAGRRSKPRTRRAALLALFSSGMFVKVLLGAVALAAVGGVAAAGVFDSGATDAVDVATTGASEVATTGASEVATTTETPFAVDEVEPAAMTSTSMSVDEPGSDASVVAYVAAVQAWADCVSQAAIDHAGEAFDPMEACPDKPSPSNFGLTGYDDGDSAPGNSENAPGQDESGPGNSENAPGQDESGPGNSENAPGQDDTGPGNSENAPGNTKDQGLNS